MGRRGGRERPGAGAEEIVSRPRPVLLDTSFLIDLERDTAKGELTAWQYAVRHAPSGELEQAPLRKVGLMANTSLRIEPYASPLKVVPHE